MEVPVPSSDLYGLELTNFCSYVFNKIRIEQLSKKEKGVSASVLYWAEKGQDKSAAADIGLSLANSAIKEQPTELRAALKEYFLLKKEHQVRLKRRDLDDRSQHAKARQEKHWLAHYAHAILVARAYHSEAGTSAQRKLCKGWFSEVFGVPLPKDPSTLSPSLAVPDGQDAFECALEYFKDLSARADQLLLAQFQ